MRAIVYLVPVALVVALGFVIVRVWRSWRTTGEQWGGGPGPTLAIPPPPDRSPSAEQAEPDPSD